MRRGRTPPPARAAAGAPPALGRRAALCGLTALAAAPPNPTPDSGPDPAFAHFRASLATEAASLGLPAFLQPVIARLHPLPRVRTLAAAQPELTQSWASYRARHLQPARIAQGRALYRADRSLFDALATEYGVPPGVLLGIWGLETDFGAVQGNFPTLDALATLAVHGNRPGFFRDELLAALRLLAAGRIRPDQLRGSYAGAMGQPQFLPSTYLTDAVDFDGAGSADIWSDRSDALASMAHYLRRQGWVRGLPWGLPVTAPSSLAAQAPSQPRLNAAPSLSAWRRAGVLPAPGPARAMPPDPSPASLLRPDPAGPDLFLVFTNFEVLRTYDRSSFYALTIGLMGDRIVG